MLRFDCELQVMNFQMNQSITFQQKGFWAHWDVHIYAIYVSLANQKWVTICQNLPSLLNSDGPHNSALFSRNDLVVVVYLEVPIIDYKT